MTSRHYCFTLNNYTDNNLEAIREKPTYVRYVIIGFEVGEAGTPHLQGYVEFDSPKRLSSLKKWLPTAHWESRRGSREVARLYCMKGIQPKEEWYSLDGNNQELRERGPTFGKDANFEEHGRWDAGGSGARTDIQCAVDRIYKGDPLEKIAIDNPSLYCRNRNGLKDFVAWHEKKSAFKWRNVEIHVLWGAAGVGKSRSVFDYSGDRNCCVATPQSEQFPLGTYDGEEVLIINDFYGQIKLSEFLNITDGHFYPINTKGGFRYALYTKIYITSNISPDEWYPELINKHPDIRAALMRRLTHVTHLTPESSLSECMIAAGKVPPAYGLIANTVLEPCPDPTDLRACPLVGCVPCPGDPAGSGACHEVLGNTSQAPCNTSEWPENKIINYHIDWNYEMDKNTDSKGMIFDPIFLNKACEIPKHYDNIGDLILDI